MKINQSELALKSIGINLVGLIVLLCILLITGLTGCESGRNKSDSFSELTVKKGFYINGELKYEGQFLNDSIREGFFKVYDINGNLTREYRFIDNEKEGKQTEYYSSGPIENEAYFKSGLQHGKSTWYYENGIKKSESNWKKGEIDGAFTNYYKNGIKESEGNWKKGEQYGAFTWYYENGKPRLFNVYDFDGINCYVIEWSKDGSKLKEEGLIFSRNASIGNKSDTVSLGEELLLHITVSNPPGSSTKMFVGDVNDSVNKYGLEQFPVEHNTVTFRKKFYTSGLKRFIIIGELRDLNDNYVSRDTVYSEYYIGE